VVVLKISEMPIKSIIIVLLLLLIVWLPVFFAVYTISMAVTLTVGFIVAGYLGNKVAQHLKKKEN
jgi:hypothetical protein